MWKILWGFMFFSLITWCNGKYESSPSLTAPICSFSSPQKTLLLFKILLHWFKGCDCFHPMHRKKSQLLYFLHHKTHFPPTKQGCGRSVRLMERRKQFIFSCFLLLKNWCVLWKGASYGAKNTVIKLEKTVQDHAQSSSLCNWYFFGGKVQYELDG